jgi:predicted hotdog family 3-hydroxylacyl-ACP dehydratase
VLPAVIGKQELGGLIAHADAMCLLDSVEFWDEERIRCHSQTHAAENNPLRAGGRLAAVHALEYAAQAIAVHGGLLARERGDTPRSGVLGGLRDVRLHAERLDNGAQLLRVEAWRLLASKDGFIYAFEVHLDQLLAARGQAIVMVSEVL